MNKRLIIADLKSNNNHGNCIGHYYSVAENYLDCLSDFFDVKVVGGPIYEKKFKASDLIELPYNSNVSDNYIKQKMCILCNTVYLLRITSRHDIIVLQQSATSTVLFFLVLFWFMCLRKTIYLIQYSTSDVTGGGRNFIYKVARPLLTGFLTTNESTGRFLGKKYCVVPDYIYPVNKHSETHSKDYDKMKYDFCILGRIAPEKGVCEVAQFLANSRYSIIIAGKPQEQELGKHLETICRNAKNITLELGFIDEDKYKGYLDESRYAILNYQGEYSIRTSGVVYDNIFSNTPVIGRKCDALQFVATYGVGALYDDLDSFDCSRIMNKEFYDNLQKNIDVYKLSHQNYIDKLRDFFQGGL